MSDDETYRERHGDEPREDPELITADDIASARHCEIKVDGLPGQLPPGRYAVSFSGMEYSVGAARPVLRFRYQGRLADSAFTPYERPEPERTGSPRVIEQAEAEGWLMPPAELPAVYRTKSGKVITDAMIEEWVAEAERGYDLDQLIPRRDHTSPPQPAQQVPDLYQVSTVETLNVSKLARVIAELLRRGVIDARAIGVPLNHSDGWGQQVEDWLRS